MKCKASEVLLLCNQTAHHRGKDVVVRRYLSMSSELLAPASFTLGMLWLCKSFSERGDDFEENDNWGNPNNSTFISFCAD